VYDYQRDADALATPYTADVTGNAQFFYVDDWEDNHYNTLSVEADNVLCINANSSYPTLPSDNKVELTADSIVDDPTFQLNFSEDQDIAIMDIAESWDGEVICKETCPEVPIGETRIIQGETQTGTVGTTSFDPGDYTLNAGEWGDPTGNVCATTTGQGIGLMISYTDIELERDVWYWLDVQINIDGTPDVDAAWLPAAAVDGMYLADSEDICADDDDTVAFTPQEPWTYYGIPTGETVWHTMRTRFRIESGSTEYEGLNAIVLDLASIGIDADELSPAQHINARVTLTRYPCQAVKTWELCVGTIVEECSGGGQGTAGADTLTFPFGVMSDPTGYWCAISVSNMTATDGTFSLTFYDEEGREATYTPPTNADGNPIPAMGQRIVMFNNIVDSLNIVDAGFDVTGKVMAVVNATVNVDGLMLIGLGDQLHGYLPRD